MGRIDHPGYKHPTSAMRRKMQREAEKAFEPAADCLTSLLVEVPLKLLGVVLKLIFWEIWVAPFKLLFGSKKK